jgi:cyanophycinase
MMRFAREKSPLLALFVALWAVNFQGGSHSASAEERGGESVASDSKPAPDSEPQGTLVIIGGALRFENGAIWSKIGELAGGEGARIAIFPTASSFPKESAARVSRRLEQLKITSFTVPVAVRNHAGDDFPMNFREQVADPRVIAEVRGATGIYFTGGSQARITEALFTADHQPTPLLEAVWDVYRRGGVIAGTSAGAAMMSETMFAHPPSGTLRALLSDEWTQGRELSQGLGFLGAGWFVDQHCLVRGRFARAIRAMLTANIPYGIGVDEDTAVVVHRQRELEVVGYKGAILMDCSAATRDADEPRFNARNVKLSYLDHGDRLNLKTLEISPPAVKAPSKIDPSSATFQPASSQRLFSADILGNTTVVELMSELLTNRHGEAVGLAFDAAQAALQGPSTEGDEPDELTGFEFRLYRGEGTCGWYSDERGCDGYTVANVRLDVQPVYVQRALYSRTPRTARPAVTGAGPKASGKTAAPVTADVAGTITPLVASDDSDADSDDDSTVASAVSTESADDQPKEVVPSQK